MADDVIVVECPECGLSYRLKPEMAGKRMRCTDSDCRAAFLVEVATHTAKVTVPPADPPFHATVPDSEPAPVFDWRDAPPPVAADETSDVPPTNEKRHQVVVAPAEKPLAISPLLLDKPTKSVARRLIILALGIFVLSGVAWGFTTLVQRFARAEERLASEAAQAFSKEEFGKAGERYGLLADEYPRSIRAGEYRFLSELAKLRRQAGLVPPAPEEALNTLTQFVHDQERGPFLKDKRHDVYAAAIKTVDDLVNEGKELIADKKVDAAQSKESLARQSLIFVERFGPAGTEIAPSKRKVDELKARLGQERAREIAKSEILKLLQMDKPDVEAAHELIRRAGFANDVGVKAELVRATERLRGLVTYEQKHQPAQPKSKIVSAGVLPNSKAIGAGSRILMIARGLLTSLDARTGRVAWAERLGAEAVWAPLKVDNSRWIVVSTEPLVLSAREANNGDVLWSQSLPSHPIGSPVLVSGHVFVALDGPIGTVLSFDANSGELLGAFAAGKPLAGGIGVRPGTGLLYVPARAHQVYVLDAIPDDGSPHCVATLTTGHSAGSLRSAPTICNLADGSLGLLIETIDGLTGTTMQLFRLPDGPLGGTVLLDRATVPGWASFRPAITTERLAVAGDRGIMRVFGMRQTGASDGTLYLLAESDNAAANSTTGRGLAMLVADDTIISIVGGRLRQWRLVIDRKMGCNLTPGWSCSEPVGVPVHPPVVDDGIAYLTSERSDPPMALATAFRLDTGEILWQRTIGFEGGAPFVRVGDAVVTVDHRGSVLALSSEGSPLTWTFGTKEIATSLSGVDQRPYVVSGPSGQWLAALSLSRSVVLRNISASLTATDQRVELPASLSGQPGFSDSGVILPLSNGVLARVGNDGKATAGPTWRTSGSSPDTLGNVTHWYGDNYLVGDGQRRLMRLRWSNGTDFNLGASSPLERTQRLLGPPIVIHGDTPRAIVADAAGNVLLVRGDPLDVERTWRLGGDGRSITTAPVLVGGLLLVGVNHRQVVAIHLDRDTPAWSFELPDGMIVGTPAEFGGKTVVADSQGRLWLLDSNTGKPSITNGYLLPGASVAVGSPISIGDDRLFVPLTDGTGIIVGAGQFALGASH